MLRNATFSGFRQKFGELGFLQLNLGRVDNSWVNLRRLGNQLGGILEPFVLVIILS